MRNKKKLSIISIKYKFSGKKFILAQDLLSLYGNAYGSSKKGGGRRSPVKQTTSTELF
jgi:hypothetical protein